MIADLEVLELRVRAAADNHLAQSRPKHLAVDELDLGADRGGRRLHAADPDGGLRAVFPADEVHGCEHLGAAGSVAGVGPGDAWRVLDRRDRVDQ